MKFAVGCLATGLKGVMMVIIAGGVIRDVRVPWVTYTQWSGWMTGPAWGTGWAVAGALLTLAGLVALVPVVMTIGGRRPHGRHTDGLSVGVRLLMGVYIVAAFGAVVSGIVLFGSGTGLVRSVLDAGSARMPIGIGILVPAVAVFGLLFMTLMYAVDGLQGPKGQVVRRAFRIAVAYVIGFAVIIWGFTIGGNDTMVQALDWGHTPAVIRPRDAGPGFLKPGRQSLRYVPVSEVTRITGVPIAPLDNTDWPVKLPEQGTTTKAAVLWIDGSGAVHTDGTLTVDDHGRMTLENANGVLTTVDDTNGRPEPMDDAALERLKAQQGVKVSGRHSVAESDAPVPADLQGKGAKAIEGVVTINRYGAKSRYLLMYIGGFHWLVDMPQGYYNGWTRPQDLRRPDEVHTHVVNAPAM